MIRIADMNRRNQGPNSSRIKRRTILGSAATLAGLTASPTASADETKIQKEELAELAEKYDSMPDIREAMSKTAEEFLSGLERTEELPSPSNVQFGEKLVQWNQLSEVRTGIAATSTVYDGQTTGWIRLKYTTSSGRLLVNIYPEIDHVDGTIRREDSTDLLSVTGDKKDKITTQSCMRSTCCVGAFTVCALYEVYFCDDECYRDERIDTNCQYWADCVQSCC